MMSTRGVKFKFSAGEKVLCYEPDPTKAKVLYESKVLDLVANRDGRGRKVCEYLIHFYGWNSSWDRYVREEFILPYTEENRQLQAKLAEEAALSLKGKKKHKLPPLIKETLSKKLCAKNDTNEQQKQQKSPSRSSSDSESSEDEVEKEVHIEIPNQLKVILENDSVMITQRNKFVKLPCEKNVVSILETYVKDYASALLHNYPPRNVKHGQALMPEDVKNKLNLCKEAMDGLRVIFDFTLQYLLLYRQEKKQFYITGLSCTPVYNPSSIKHEPSYEDGVEIVDSFLRESEFMQENDQEEAVDELNYKKHETEAAIRNFKLRYLANNPNHCNQSGHSDSESAMHSGANVQKTDEIAKQHNQSPKEKSSKRMKTQNKSTSTRILRSSDKLKQQSSSDELSLSVNFETSENNCVTPTPKTTDCPSEPTSPLRVTRKSGHNTLSSPIHQQASPSSISCDRSMPNSPTSSIPNIEQFLPQSISSNNFSSSNSSTHSTISNDMLGSQQYLQAHNSHLLEEIHNWRMVPEHIYVQAPAAPSLIYGAHHLLRLFVKLPSLISKMHIKPNKLEVLLQILENFLLYLVDKSEDLFLESVYIDSYDVFPSSVLGMMY